MENGLFEGFHQRDVELTSYHPKQAGSQEGTSPLQVIKTPLHVHVTLDKDRWYEKSCQVFTVCQYVQIYSHFCNSISKDVFILSLGMLHEATDVVCAFSLILIIERMSISMHAEAITDHFAYIIYTSCQYVLNYS